MESRANYAAIGGFVLFMVAVGLALVGWLANIGQSQGQADIRVVFSGAVTGLSTGSSVLFNGIKIGEVRLLTLDENDPRTVVAVVRVNRNIPLKTDTRATLSYQGLTGAANLQLEGGSRNAPLLIDSVEDGMPTMQAEISPFQDILESARNVLTRADSAMAAIDEFITENRPALSHTIANVDTFTTALSDNSPAISDALGAISDASGAIKEISGSLKGSIARAEEILNAVEPEKVTALVDRLISSSERLDAILANAETISNGIDPKTVNAMMDNIASAAKTLDETVSQAHEVLSAVDPKAVDELVGRVSGAADRIDAAARKAAELMAAVDTDRVKSIVGSVDTATKNLADASGTVGGAIDKAKEALSGVSDVVAAVDPAKVRSTVDDVSDFAASLKGYKPEIDAIIADVHAASGSLKALGATIDARRPDIDAIVANAGTLVEQMNGIASRTDGVIAKLDKYVEGGGDGLVKEATEAARNIREVAATLKTRIGPITDNVSRFSGRGLDSLVAMADQGRLALARLDRVLQGVEQNPQQFIFGGGGVPEYSPRRR